MAKSKDLFDESTMSFGEHLEVLRVHLWKALIGLVIAVIFALFFGQEIVAIIRGPIDRALATHGLATEDDLGGFDFMEYVQELMNGKKDSSGGSPDKTDQPKPKVLSESEQATTIEIQFRISELARLLHELNPEAYPAVDAGKHEKDVSLQISADEFGIFRQTTLDLKKPVTLNVQEAFMTYIKVSFVAGLILASPWVFFQIWQFVAAGLYPHEQRYIYVFLPVSLTLFIGGAAFCFYVVFSFILNFLLSFNSMLHVLPQIRLSEWISFAIILPLMFGISFQLPLVMLFLERISIFEASDYREKRRMSILVIAVASMLLTPADPASMLLMMFPMLFLYEMGILLCQFTAAKSPFEAEGT